MFYERGSTMADEYVMKESSGRYLVNKIKNLLNLKQDKITFSGNANEYLNGSGKFSTPPGGLTYGLFNATTDGLVPKTETSGGVTRYLREDGNWAVPPDHNTTYGVFNTTDMGLVPRTVTATGTRFIRDDGAWATPPDTTYDVFNYYTAGLVPAPGYGTATKVLTDTGWTSSDLLAGSSSSPLDAYPVGAYYLSNSSTSPATLFGGTWTQITTGNYLRSNTGSGVTSSGSSSHTHTLGSAYGRYYQRANNSGQNIYSYKSTETWSGNYGLSNAGNATEAIYASLKYGMELAGSTDASTADPAYQYMYVWRRTK